nr:MAG TPA: Lipocalin BARREL, LIPOCALIN, LIGAND BINDING [Caudoviricetes sp.]
MRGYTPYMKKSKFTLCFNDFNTCHIFTLPNNGLCILYSHSSVPLF